MARLRKKHDLVGGPGDISEQLWHYDGSNAYKEYDGRTSRVGFLSRRRSAGDDAGMDKLTQFMSAGGMRHERHVPDDDLPARRKSNVIRVLAAFALIWIIFLFVAL